MEFVSPPSQWKAGRAVPVRIIDPRHPTHRKIAMAWDDPVPSLSSQAEEVELGGMGTLEVVGRGIGTPTFPKVSEV